jgi:GntR family transcriptional regulator
MSIMGDRDQIAKDGKAMRLAQRPLYAQVREVLVRRLVDGVWSPGEALPSEMELAAELDVSQGTVRKALDSMTADKLVVRHQGRGTFVAVHDEARILFQFFKLVPDAGEAAFPESRVIGTATETADESERRAFGLRAGAKIIRIRRLRSLAGRTVIAEHIALPAALFPRLTRDEIPNNLYGLYATRYGLAIARAEERLKAVALGAKDAALLRVRPGTPALRIDRLARSLSGRSVEWRVSLCLTQEFHYLSELD